MKDSQENSFVGGVNQDLSKYLVKNNTAYNSSNFRVVSAKGLSTKDLEAIAGNLDLLPIPNTTRIQKLTIVNNGIITLTINNILASNSFDTTGKTYKDLYNYILTEFPGNIPSLYSVYYGDNYVIIVPTTTLIDIVSSDNSILLSTPNYIPAQTGLEIIGNTYINDDIYILTTNNKTKNPGGHNPNLPIDSSSIGQIWKIVINPVDISVTIELKYNNYIDFSTYNAFSPTSILGRYENPNIQRIYFTDYFNKLRTLNVANTQSLAIDTSILDITPSVDFDIPILTNIISITGPTIPVGEYQMAYRLSNVSGAVTTFSELSNQVFVADGSPIGLTPQEFKNYIGAGQGTPEGVHITWAINNLDRDFDRIEFAIVQKENLIATPNIFLVGDQPIFSDSINFTYDGSLETTPISLNEFIALSGVFTHTKTITTKDNRLVAGNVQVRQGELDFDTRVYRFPISNTTFDITNNGVTSSFNSSNWNTIPETSDAINSNIITQRYKENSIILGGSGINISYEFVTIASRCDQSTDGTFSVPPPAPWRLPNRNYSEDFINLGINSNGIEQEYTNVFTNGKTLGGLKYTNVNGVLKGYQRNETYRIGIQFFDKSKNPYFVKWIGDIKMPDFSDINNNCYFEDGITSPALSIFGGVNYDFRLSFVATVAGQEQAFVQSLGIKFNINKLEAISDKISGYTIVRVKREEKDKSIISGGYISAVIDGGTGFYTSSPSINASGNPITWTNYAPVYNKVCFSTPNLCNAQLTAPLANNIFKIKFILQHVNNPYNNIVVPPNTGPNYYFKMYNNDLNLPNGEQQTTLSRSQYISFGDTLSTSGNPFHNFDLDDANHHDDRSYSIGNETYIFELNSNNSNLYTDLYNSDSFGKYYVNIERVLTNQYGGNTYTQRSQNEYISCCNFVPVKSTSRPFINNFYTFGGDTFTNLYDDCRWAKNLGGTGRGQVTGPITYTSVMFFPVESSINTELRNGKYINRSFNDLAEEEFRQDSTYNSIYSSEDDIRIYFHKPDPYLPNSEYSNRFYISDIKIDGELIDSWGIFKTLNYWDVEGSFGPINGVSYLQNEVYFIQDKAFGKLFINPKTAVTSIDGEEIEIGRGNIIDSHEYVSTEIGSKHQFSFNKSNYYLYFWNDRHNKFYSFSQNRPLEPLSDMKGLHSWCLNFIKGNVLIIDKPVYDDPEIKINGVHCVFDYINNEMIYTISTSYEVDKILTQFNYTIVYNESTQSWTSTNYSHYPKQYITNNKFILSTSRNNLQQLYLHNYGETGKFYGEYFDSFIEFFVNKFPKVSKMFTNIAWNTEIIDINGLNIEGETFNSIECSTDYQTTGIIPLVNNSNLKRLFRTWRTTIPKSTNGSEYMSVGFMSNLKDKVMKVKLSFKNNANKSFIVRYIENFFNVTKPN